MKNLKIVFVLVIGIYSCTVMHNYGDRQIKNSVSDLKGRKGEIFLTRNINFKLDLCDLSKGSYSVLDSIVIFLNNNEKVHLEIGVHSAIKPDKSNSRNMSLCRSEEIKNYFINQGINPDRLFSVGYEWDYPIKQCRNTSNNNCKEEALYLNRRVEFRIR